MSFIIRALSVPAETRLLLIPFFELHANFSMFTRKYDVKAVVHPALNALLDSWFAFIQYSNVVTTISNAKHLPGLHLQIICKP